MGYGSDGHFAVFGGTVEWAGPGHASGLCLGLSFEVLVQRGAAWTVVQISQKLYVESLQEYHLYCVWRVGSSRGNQILVARQNRAVRE